MLTLFAACSVFVWLMVLLLPWQPWRTRERLVLPRDTSAGTFDAVSVLIPARNEAACIAETLRRLSAQGKFNQIILVDDQSDDGTADVAAATGAAALVVVTGSEPPPGWSGKMWALAQGFERCESNYVLLLDADIGLNPGVVRALVERLEGDAQDMVSVMANLHMHTAWEKLLLPPFVYFFRLIYPFALANAPRSRVAAGAGGCVLLRAEALRKIGGFAAIRDAIIDDCTLAKKIKTVNRRIWIGLSNDVCALRPYKDLSTIWNMVARSAYTQLRYSPVLLLASSALLLLSYCLPVAVLGTNSPARVMGVTALLLMFVSYYPTVRYYRLPAWWTVTLPFAAILFLGMTWTSAWRYLHGERSRWKNRVYARISE